MAVEDFEVGDRITVNKFSTRMGGTIEELSSKRIKVLLDSTTTGKLSEYSLRKDGTWVQVGWSMNDANYGGWFYDTGRVVKNPSGDEFKQEKAVKSNRVYTVETIAYYHTEDIENYFVYVINVYNNGNIVGTTGVVEDVLNTRLSVRGRIGKDLLEDAGLLDGKRWYEKTNVWLAKEGIEYKEELTIVTSRKKFLLKT